jgi:hypothetical protein
MRDPTTDLVVKKLTELAIERLSDRRLANTLAAIEQLRRDLIDAVSASDPITATDRIVKELIETAIEHFSGRRLANVLAGIGVIRRDLHTIIAGGTKTGGSRQPARKRGRPNSAVPRHMQIASAVAMLVEDAGLKPTRSHLVRRLRSPSACSIVAAALEQLGEHRSERTVEDIWKRYPKSSVIIHQKVRDRNTADRP